MPLANNPGRAVGLMMLVQAACGGLVYGVLLRPALAPPGFLVNAAPHATTFAVVALLGLVGGALSIGMVVAAWPVLRATSHAMALWMFAFAGAGLALAAVENVGLLAMLSLSQDYAKAGAAATAQFDVAAGMLKMLRYWAHYMKLIVGVATLWLLLAALLRHGLLPRVLAGLALAATTLQLVVVTLPVFGWKMQFAYLAPAGVMFLAVALWLAVRGFAMEGAPAHAVATAATS
jgi:hypothetical protein